MNSSFYGARRPTSAKQWVERVVHNAKFQFTVKKGEALLGFALLRKLLESSQIARHGGLGDLESQQKQLAVDAA